MAQQEITDRLLTIIRRIKLDSMTGLLMVSRGEGIFLEDGTVNYQPRLPSRSSQRSISSMIEEGSISFLNGKMVEAKIGRRSGSDAFNYLSTWGKCLYSFTQANADMTATLSSRVASIDEHAPIRQGRPATFDGTPTNVSRPDDAEKTSREQPLSSPAQRTPLRLKQTQQGILILEKMSFSRAHRQLFLLIDDQRTINDLARLTNSSREEIESRLEDLEKAAVVKWSHTQVPKVRPFPKTEK